MNPTTYPSSRILLPLLALGLLSSCTFLPSSGPSLSRVKSNSNQRKFTGQYVLVPVSKQVLEILGKNTEVTESPRSGLDLKAKSSVMQRLFRQGTPELLGGKPSDSVVQGDVVKVTIFDSGGSLFATPIMPNGMSQTGAIPHELPPQLVDNSGEIMVPYAGRIMARGRSVGQIQDEIQTKLKGKTVDPQVVVTIAERKGGDCVSVMGDVRTPSRVSVSLAGTRVLDALAQAGGSTGKEYETVVSVNRAGTTRTAFLSEIFESPAKNIFLQFGDSIIVRVRAQKYLCFGANNRLAEVPFDDDRLTLAKALAKVGGADDNQANPSSILLYRMEPREKVEAMGLKPVGSDTGCPVIYRLDLTQADGFFLARNFTMRDHDIIYTTSAGSIGVRKFLGLIGSIFAPAAQAGGTAAGLATTAIAL
jgi:polysaccharide export outer membrane protein